MAAPAALRPMAAASLQHAARIAGRRAFATQQRPQLATPKLQSPAPLSASPVFRLAFRRAYADSVGPVPPKKKGFRWFRWLWRATYMAAISGAAYGVYGVYEMRNPPDQPNPDPTKKTLVILGALPRPACANPCTDGLLQEPVGDLSLS